MNDIKSFLNNLASGAWIVGLWFTAAAIFMVFVDWLATIFGDGFVAATIFIMSFVFWSWLVGYFRNKYREFTDEHGE